MHKFLLRLFIILISFTLLSCKDEITNNYPQEKDKGNAPDVNIIYSNYSFETVHSYHMDTTAYPQYNYSINLNLVLDKPENRAQINKMIIVSDLGLGWEFFADDLESFYSDSLKGYKIENLLYRLYESQPYFRIQVMKVHLFSNTNEASEEYQFVLNPSYITFDYVSHDWYTQSVYQVNFSYSTINGAAGKIFWLNNKKEIISHSELAVISSPNQTYFRENNVPANAYYFYIYFERLRDGVRSSLKSSVFAIANRYPENIQILGESIYNLDYVSSVKYIPTLQKILLLDRNNPYFYVVDYNTWSLEKKITLSNPISFTFSEYNNNIYVGTSNGTLYSIALNESTPKLVKKLGASNIRSLITVNKFLIAGCSDNSFRVLNLETNSVSVRTTDYSTPNVLVFNKTNNVIYGASDYNLIRFGFDPNTGTISDYRGNYSSGSQADIILYPDGSKLILSTGQIYNCSTNSQTDLTSAGRIVHNFSTGFFSEDNNNLITLKRAYYSSDPRELAIFNVNSKEMIGYTADFNGEPISLAVDGDMIKVISRLNGKLAAEKYSYSQLISGNQPGNKITKEKYYLPIKIN